MAATQRMPTAFKVLLATGVCLVFGLVVIVVLAGWWSTREHDVTHSSDLETNLKLGELYEVRTDLLLEQQTDTGSFASYWVDPTPQGPSIPEYKSNAKHWPAVKLLAAGTRLRVDAFIKRENVENGGRIYPLMTITTSNMRGVKVDAGALTRPNPNHPSAVIFDPEILTDVDRK